MPMTNMPHQLGVTAPTLSRDDRWGQVHPALLNTPPMPHSPQLLAIFVEDGVIHGPGPLPTTLGRFAFAFDMTPKGNQDFKAQTPQPLEPGAFGQGVQKTRGPVLVPPPHPTELRGRATAKEGGEHDTDDFTQQLLLAL